MGVEEASEAKAEANARLAEEEYTNKIKIKVLIELLKTVDTKELRHWKRAEEIFGEKLNFIESIGIEENV